jgi:hypothetical protein
VSVTQTDGRDAEALLVARLLRNINVDFLWTIKSESINWQAVDKGQIVNRLPRTYFTTKVIYVCKTRLMIKYEYIKQEHFVR